MEDKSKKKQIFSIIWVYIKILLVIGVQIIAFLSSSIFFHVRWILLVFGIILCIIVKIKFRNLIPLIKFLALNMVPIFLIYYYANLDWILALSSFADFLIKMLLLLMSVILFSHTTSQYKLMISLTRIGIPKRIAFIVMNLLTFIPLISEQIHLVVLSQKARGYKVRLLNLRPIIVPVVLHLLDFSINISLSLESRGMNI